MIAEGSSIIFSAKKYKMVGYGYRFYEIMISVIFRIISIAASFLAYEPSFGIGVALFNAK